MCGWLASCVWVCLCLRNRELSIEATSVTLTSSYSTSWAQDCCSVTVSHNYNINKSATWQTILMKQEMVSHIHLLFLNVYLRGGHKNVLFLHHPASLSLTHTRTKNQQYDPEWHHPWYLLLISKVNSSHSDTQWAWSVDLPTPRRAQSLFGMISCLHSFLTHTHKIHTEGKHKVPQINF